MLDMIAGLLGVTISASAVIGLGVKLVSAVNRNLFLLQKIDQDLQVSVRRTDRLESWLRHHEISMLKSELTYKPFNLD